MRSKNDWFTKRQLGNEVRGEVAATSSPVYGDDRPKRTNLTPEGGEMREFQCQVLK
jgi:hypothetical protein